MLCKQNQMFFNVVKSGKYSNRSDLKAYEWRVSVRSKPKMGSNGEKNGTLTMLRGQAALPSTGQKHRQQLSQSGVIIIANLNVLTRSFPQTIVCYCLLLVLTCGSVRRPYDSDIEWSRSLLFAGWMWIREIDYVDKPALLNFLVSHYCPTGALLFFYWCPTLVPLVPYYCVVCALLLSHWCPTIFLLVPYYCPTG